ncbi:MAG: response regulator transcription factor [Saprospiraceae bacterium]
MQNISIVIADGQYLIRAGLRAMLSATNGFNIIGDARNEKELLNVLSHKPADVVIIDYDQPEKFSVNTIQSLKDNFPETELLVISADNNKQTIYKAIENGVRSFLTKECDQAEIIDAVISTSKHEKFFCSKVMDFIFEKSFPDKVSDCAPMPLSGREIEIVQLVAKGMIAKEIAAKLNLSTHTIYTHRKNIMKKLGFSSTSELVLFAVKTGIVPSDS